MHDDYILDEDLPQVILEMKGLIGMQKTLKLVEVYGGLHLKIPIRFNDDHPLTRLLGHHAVLKLIGRFGGDTLYIAKADALLRIQRNIEIAQRFDSGVPARTLARDYHLSERQIWTILKTPETLRRPGGPEQGALF